MHDLYQCYRVLELEPAKFHGVFIGKDAKLPLAYMRFDDRAKWRFETSKALAAASGVWASPPQPAAGMQVSSRDEARQASGP